MREIKTERIFLRANYKSHFIVQIQVAHVQKENWFKYPSSGRKGQELRYGNLLRLPGIMIGRHFHASMKVQTATCKDNNNSKSRAATYVKFQINIK